MSTKREEKKRLYKSKILKAASKMFKLNGYDNTTIEQISKEAEVGVGTTYLHFKSKSELYRATIQNELNIKDMKVIFENIDYSDKPSLQISKVSCELINQVYELDKEMIKDYMHSFFKGSTSESDLVYATILDADDNIKDGYKEVIKNYVDKCIFKEGFNKDICLDLMFNIIIEALYSYVVLSKDEKKILDELEQKIKFIIEPYEK